MNKLDFIKTEDFYMTKDTRNKAKRQVRDLQEEFKVHLINTELIFTILGKEGIYLKKKKKPNNTIETETEHKNRQSTEI